ncbi:MAG: ATP-binding cassette domain-containing protein [Oscillospiraceae bacterium]|nr:ATP-binding cassette domain-containing protein [Oscillospiraceae bacterium]
MKLLYELSAKDETVVENAVKPDKGEKLMYCLPFNMLDGNFVKGYMVFTNKKMYKILEGKLLAVYDIIGSSDFKTEVMYGSGGFYAKINGNTTLICQFIVGRNLPRYAVMVKACEILNETGDETPLVNSSPERFCPKCGRPYLHGSQICPFCMKKFDVYMKLWAMTKGLRLAMFFPFIVASIGILVQFGLPVIQRHITDTYLVPKIPIQTDQISGVVWGFASWVALLVTIDLFQRALGVASARLLALASGKFLIMLRTLLYEKIQTLSLSSIQRHSTGELMTRVSNDTGVMQNFIIQQLPSIFTQVISLPIAIVILFVMNWITALFVLVPIPFAIFIITRFWGYIHSKNMRMWRTGTRMQYLLQDILRGIRVVKSFGQEDKEIDKFNNISLEVARQQLIISRIWSTIWPFITTLINSGVYFIIWYAGSLVIGGKITLGMYNQFFSYTNIVYGPLVALANIPNNISNFLTSSSKVFEILEETPEILDIDLPLDIKIEGDISVKKATFGYQSYNPVLENINLEIKAGEMIGLVGHSGSGKTTLINLLMRLYEVNEGEILIDNVNIKDISQEALRSQIGVVLQETFLFTGTVKENIRYSKPYATDEEVIEAARIANAHDFIVNLPEGYNTLVGERGYSMSGGERQRVAIARAVIHNPRILILDEATASLDTETEKLIQDALNKLSQNRTTIAIAHRLSTLRNANKLLVLDKGKVAEFGTHEELLHLKGIYYKLVMAQREMAHQIVGEEDEETA